MNKPVLKLTSAVLLAAATVSTAYAGGFMLTEQSALGLGRAYAGAGIVGDDLSAVWYNSAGMTLLPGTQFQAGGVTAFLDLSIETAGGQQDNGRKHGVPIPNMFITHQISEDTWFGFGLTVPYGMATEYSRNWQLRQWGMNSEIKVFDLNPNMAWRLTDKLSLGVGFSLQYAMAHFESASALALTHHGRLSADSWSWGGNLGLMWEPTDTVRLGLAYRSSVKHDASGTYKVGTEATGYTKQGPGAASLTAPHTVMLTGTWEATDALRLSTMVRWADWSSFDKLTITSAFTPDTVVTNKWKDSWLFTVGADYTVSDEWTVRTGLGYEIAPVDNDIYRTAVIPDTDRLWLSVGATWHVTKNLQGDFSMAWLHGVGDKGLYKPDGTQVGEFTNLDAYLFGAQMVYKF